MVSLWLLRFAQRKGSASGFLLQLAAMHGHGLFSRVQRLLGDAGELGAFTVFRLRSKGFQL